jgi:arylsulfatase A-like enzyme
LTLLTLIGRFLKRMGGRSAVVMVAAFLIGLRVLAFHGARADLALTEPLMTLRTEPVVALGVAQYFVLSLCFELAALVLLSWLVRWSAFGRWVSRGLVAILLWINLAGTMVFLVLRTYAKGFHLTGLSLREMQSVVAAFVTPLTVLGLIAPLGMALLFGRNGSGERIAQRGSTALLRLAVGLVAFAGAFQLIRNPTRYPSIAHSPATLLFVRTLPQAGVAASIGKASPEDWMPARELAAPWSALREAERNFNLVVVVLESVRADVFWPSPHAPPLPHLERLAPHAAVFTRAYAHEPLSIKGLEALLFGIYPAPYWESLTGKKEQIALDSVPERWSRLGMRTAFIGYGEIPFIGERAYLQQRGFSEVIEGPELQKIDDQYNDRTLVRALDQFISTAPNDRFGAFLWPHHTHMPYQLPSPLSNPHPATSFEAYRDTVVFLDQVIGDLHSLLERRRLIQNTVIVLVADHGESFAEHGESGRGHGDWLFEATAHVPLIFINPVLFHGERDERIVQQKDVAATIAWLAGAGHPDLNLGSSVFFQKPSESAYLISHLDTSSLRGAFVRGRLKYVFREGAEGLPDDDRLFDLIADPGETANLWREYPIEARQMKERYFGWLSYWNQRWLAVQLSTEVSDRRWVNTTLLGRETP